MVYDPHVVSYRELVDHFWRTVDPTQADGQFCDHGPFYRAEAYHQNYHEKKPLTYKYDRWRCGRDQRLEELWGE